ncbi:hypothetical protein DFH07DRAFT_1067421 [Mycena maculata]|uniref:Uncharacterized protein n=1 Tax=Mycena maculata TaxID=230809 RepID=A0AAD7HLD0_9AGAR|nr:hypothetical protein DFH07DRAFT_1067421 [Mycena maculata]
MAASERWRANPGFVRFSKMSSSISFPAHSSSDVLSITAAREYMLAEMFQPRSRPLFVDHTARRPSFGTCPAHYDHLARQVGQENVLRRTHHVVRRAKSEADTHDASIRRMFRRRSSVSCPTQFEEQYMSEPLY